MFYRHASCLQLLLIVKWSIALKLQNDNCDPQSELMLFFGVQHKLLVCPQQIAGGHGSLQVSKEKSDQFILLRTPCERVRALPCLQSQQGQWVNAWCHAYLCKTCSITVTFFVFNIFSFSVLCNHICNGFRTVITTPTVLCAIIRSLHRTLSD